MACNPINRTYEEFPPEHLFDRGYTGHEHLDIFGLVNMNGRLYDPWLGRMLSPDPFVQAPTYSQNYNRYSYALNNPLKYTDPSGYIHTYGFGGAEDRKLDLRYENGRRTQSEALWQMDMAANGYNSSSAPGWGGTASYVYRGGGIYTNGPDVVSYSEVYNNYIVPNSATVSVDAQKGMSIYSVSAFGRVTLVSSFGDIGTMIIDVSGGIGFSNPTSAAYLFDAIVAGQSGGGELENLSNNNSSSLPTVTHIVSEHRINGLYASARSYTKAVDKGNSKYSVNFDRWNNFESVTSRTPLGSITVGNNYVLYGDLLSVGVDDNNYIIDISIPLQNSAIGGITLTFDKAMTNQVVFYGWAVSAVFVPELRLIPIP